jgi:S-adenosylmethionine/arginine decarboxylase-like enzyme
LPSRWPDLWIKQICQYNEESIDFLQQKFPKFKSNLMKIIQLGYQLTATFERCNSKLVSDPDNILEFLRFIAKEARYEEVSCLKNTFPANGGVTCVLILAQSHLIAHSWPEYDILVIDLFACGAQPDYEPIFNRVKSSIQAESVTFETRIREANVELSNET